VPWRSQARGDNLMADAKDPDLPVDPRIGREVGERND
jgi:hypothetical protein